MSEELFRALRRNKDLKRVVKARGPGLLKRPKNPLRKTAEIDKEALLGWLLGNLSRVHPRMDAAKRDALATAVRKGVATKIAPTAMRAADVPLKGLDKLLTTTSSGTLGLSPERRYKFLKFVAENPVTVLGAAGGAVPLPAAAELGMATTGALSVGAKKLLKIPTHADLSIAQFSKNVRKRGYEDMMDYLAKTKAKASPLVPADYAELKHQLSPFGSSLF